MSNLTDHIKVIGCGDCIEYYRILKYRNLYHQYNISNKILEEDLKTPETPLIDLPIQLQYCNYAHFVALLKTS